MTQTPAAVRYFPNRYAGTCKVCRNRVAEQAGFTGKEDGRYVCYCKAHAPVRISEETPTGPRKMTAEGIVYTPYEPANLPLLRSLPGARWNPDKQAWTFSLDMGDRQRVLEIADSLGLEVDASLRQVTQTEQMAKAVEMGLRPFQVKGVSWISLRKGALLADDMGCGKTVQAIVSLPENAASIVICPAAVKYNWRDEIAKWRPSIKVIVCNGKGSFQFPRPGEMVIVNFDILPERFAEPSAEDRAELSKCHLIVDEAHRAKNYKTARSKRVAGMSQYAKAVWGLTGTPLMNRPGDLYGVLSSLGMSREVFGSWTNFLKLFHATKNSWGGIDWGTPDPSVPERLRRVMLRRTKAEVLPELPARTVTNLTVNGIPKSLQAKLDRLDEEWGDVVEAGVLPPFEEFSSVRAELAESRIAALTEMVEDHEEQEIPLIVASAHLAPIESLKDREGWAIITGSTKAEDRQEVVRRFQAGELKGVGLTIQAGGVGLTLTRAWKMIFVDRDWVPSNNLQCMDRINRIGQTRACEYVFMVSDHPLDQHVGELIEWKMDMIQKSVEDRVQVVVPAAAQAETEEQFAARMEERAKAIAEAGAVTLPDRHVDLKNRMVKRAALDILPLTPARVEAIKGAYAYMLSVCDGAVQKDSQGFNQPDAIIARRVLAGRLDQPEYQEIALAVLTRYYRQLHEQFPVLFTKAEGE